MKRKTSKFPLVAGVLIVVAAAAAGFSVQQLHAAGHAAAASAAMTVKRNPYVEKNVTVTKGSTFGTIMAGVGLSLSDTNAIIAASKKDYDLTQVQAGRPMRVVLARKTGDLHALVYGINSDQQLVVTRTDGKWAAKLADIPYVISEREAKGTVETSVYAAGIKAGMEDKAIVELGDVFQWTVDFALGVQKGDTFDVIYEERSLSGKSAGPGHVLAAKFVNNGTAHYAFRFTTSDGKTAYYDENGESLQKMFLKAPVHYKYITSGYTTSPRYVTKFHQYTASHRAIDYAAPVGTPIRAVGDGTIIFAGRNGPYGNFTEIRHNSVYQTNYAHQSKILVHVGEHVKQGQIIGLVGTTGYSTGPHLHFEMEKNGVKINPLKEVFPSAGPVPSDQKSAFEAVVKKYKPRLDD